MTLNLLLKCNLYMKKNSFRYWFAHWCAYQEVAKAHGCWRFRFLFHDWYKPWLGLIWKYEKVRQFHRKYSRHHPEGKLITNIHKLDYIGMIIDWEASTVSKSKIKPEDSNGAWWVTENIWPQFKPYLLPLLKKYCFKKIVN